MKALNYKPRETLSTVVTILMALTVFVVGIWAVPAYITRASDSENAAKADIRPVIFPAPTEELIEQAESEAEPAGQEDPEEEPEEEPEKSFVYGQDKTREAMALQAEAEAKAAEETLDKIAQARAAAAEEENAVEETEAEIPEETQPAAPEETQPAAPEETQPAAPEETQPAAPEETQPAAPEETQPAAPEETQPAAPEETQPAAPEETQPEAPAEEVVIVVVEETQPTPPPVEVVYPSEGTWEYEILVLINNARAEAGVQPLSWSWGLRDAAAVRAGEIIASFSHTRPDGSDYWTVNEALVYGENIAAGQTSAQEVFNSWMNSPDHRANILRSDFRTVAVARADNPDPADPYGVYWAQEFGL